MDDNTARYSISTSQHRGGKVRKWQHMHSDVALGLHCFRLSLYFLLLALHVSGVLIIPYFLFGLLVRKDALLDISQSLIYNITTIIITQIKHSFQPRNF
jgi:hypothetical protein